MNDERISDERMSSEPATNSIDLDPIIEAGINCGFYFVVMLFAVVLDRIFPDWTAMTCALVLLPYLITLGFILLRRSMGRPWFLLGDAGTAFFRLALVWAILILIACIFAYSNGLFRPMSLVGKLNHLGTIVEEPLAQEFVFRAALLTSLSRTRLGVMAPVLGVPMTVVAGAVVFSVLHSMIFLAAGFGFSDVLITGTTVLITSVAFGVIYVRTQNVWYGVLLHMLLNFGRWG